MQKLATYYYLTLSGSFLLILWFLSLDDTSLLVDSASHPIQGISTSRPEVLYGSHRADKLTLIASPFALAASNLNWVIDTFDLLFGWPRNPLNVASSQFGNSPEHMFVGRFSSTYFNFIPAFDSDE